MKKIVRITGWLVAGVGLTLTAQGKVTYEDHVYPVLRNRCNKCHNSNDLKGNLDLSTFQGVLRGGGSGEVVNSGDPGGSKLLRVVTHEEEPTMPPNSGKIPDNEIKIISDWIAEGMLETSGSKKIDPRKPAFDLAVSAGEIGKPEGPPAMPKDLLLEPVVKGLRPTAVRSMASSPWAPLVAVTGQKQILIYNTDSLSLSAVIPFEEGFPNDLKFSRNGKLLLAGGGYPAREGLVNVYDVETGQRVISVGDEFDAVQAADISADQKWIALGGPSRLIRVYTTATGELVHEMKKHTDWVTAIEFSPNGKLLATGDRAGNLFVWDSASGQNLYNLKGHRGAVKSVSWRADSTVLLSGSEDATLKLWNVSDEEAIKSWTGHGGGVQFVRYGMNGSIVSSGRDKRHTLWDASGNRVRNFNAIADVGVSVALSHDGEKVIGADWTGNIGVWNAKDGKLLGQLDSNPPFIDERLQMLASKLPEKKKAADAANAGFEKVNARVKAIQAEAAKLNEQSMVTRTTGVASQSASLMASLEKDLAAPQKQLADQVTKSQGTSEQSRKKLDELKAKLASTDKVSPEWRKVAADLDGAKAKVTALGKQIEDTKQASVKSAGDLKKAAADVESLTKKLAGLEEGAADKGVVEKEFAARQAELEKLTAASKKGSEDAANLEKQLADAKKQVAALDEKLKKTGKDNPAYKALETQVAEADKAYKAAAGSLAEAKKELAAVQSANQKALDGLKQAKAAAESLAASLKKTDPVHRQWEQKVKELEGAKAELAKADAARKQAVADMTGLEKSIAFWKAAEFNVSVIEERKELAKLTLGVEEAKATLTSLDRDLVSMASELKKLDKQIASIPDQIEGAKNIIGFAQGWVNDAAAAVKASEVELRKATELAAARVAAFEKAREGSELASQKVDAMKTLRKQMADAGKKAATDKSGFEKTNAAVEAKTDELEEAKKTLADLNSKPEGERPEDFDKQVAAAKKVMADRQKELASLQKKADQMDNAFQKATSELEDLKEQYASAQGDSAEKMAGVAANAEMDAKKSLDLAKAAVDKQKKALAEAKDSLKQEQAGLVSAQADLKKAEELNKVLPGKRKEVQAGLQKAEKDLQDWKIKLAELEKKLTEQTAKVESMTKRYHAMKNGTAPVQNAGL